MVYYDVRTKEDRDAVAKALKAAGCRQEDVEQAVANLEGWNSGYTFTNFGERLTIMAVGKATSAEQMFDSIVHEMKHLAEHVGEYYGVDSKSELSAYLQGEVGRKMWPAAAMVLCPRCRLSAD
jgi:hypothetical protein